jgi:hypothetical protein
MTPEEKFNTAMQWTLRAIKEQQLLTPQKENIKLNVAHLTNIDPDSPRMDVVAGCIRKLEEWNVIKMVDKYDQFSNDTYSVQTDWDRANTFEFFLYQQKFDELYLKDEGGSNDIENQKISQQKTQTSLAPEEKYHADRWFVLQKIREQELYAPNKNEIPYRLEITPYSQFDKHSPSAQVNIIKQLADEKAIEILDEQGKSGYGAYYLFVFKIKRPKFDELYQSYKNQHGTEGGRLGTSEPPKNNIQILADQLNKDFADDKKDVQIARAWFEALANGAKPADGKTELEGFQTMVAQTLINLEPFRRRLAENAKVINQISQNLIMPNLEAVKPMLKEIEDSLGRVSRFYNPPQNLTITAPLPPKISETIEKGEIMTEIRALRNEVERLTDIKAPNTAQESAKNDSEIQEQDKRPFCIIEGKWGFLKFSKQGKKIKIGGTNSQSFKLLTSLTEPFGTAKSVDVVFEAIREGIKYKSKSGVYTSGIDRPQKITLIEYAIKELQKGDKLQGKLVFKWDDMKAKIWLQYLG